MGEGALAHGSKPAHRPPSRPPSVQHPVLDVYSIQQGSLRLYVFIPSIVILALLGLYFSVGAVINFHGHDYDARDMITNLRQMILARDTQHRIYVDACTPKEVIVSSSKSGDLKGSQFSKSVEPITVLKSRDRLSDPRLLTLVDVAQPMVGMREKKLPSGERIPTAWTYHEAYVQNTRYPSFGWDKTFQVNISYPISSDRILQSVQIFNTFPRNQRPDLIYKQTTNDQEQKLWNVEAVFTLYVPAFKIVGPGLDGNISVRRLNQTLVEARFFSMDTPATFVQTEVAAKDYRNGRPVFREVKSGAANETDGKVQTCDNLFNAIAQCRDTIHVPHVFNIEGSEYVEFYKGSISGLKEAVAVDLVASFKITIRDYSQPRPYAPLMTGFGEPFFIGFAALAIGILFILIWWGLRFYLVNKNVRENEGKPPMFYQSMLRFRGW